MREIKFKYWNSVTNKMVNEPKMPYKDGWTITQLFSERGWVWLQYTGLRDKNGKEIYEGDIVDGHSDGLGKIEWQGTGWVYTFDDTNCVGLDEICLWFGNNAKVIGNIYENPELLAN